MTADGGSDAIVLFDLTADLRPPNCTGTSSFAAIRSDILSSCSYAGNSCHLTAPFEGGLDLTAANAYSALVNAQAMRVPGVRVKPGAPLDSFLWRKLDGRVARDGSEGFPMPLGAENFWFPLPAKQRAQIYCWIQSGAPNN